MNKNKLTIKDLVTMGAFSVIYFVVMLSLGMIGIIPLLFLIYPTILGIISGIIVILYMEKVKKPLGIFIFGILPPLCMFLMGHTYVVLLHGLLIMSIAEILRSFGHYQSKKWNILSFMIFNTWICGSLLQMIFAKTKYIEMSMKMMGKDYTMALERLITYKNMAFVYLGAMIGAFIGALIAYKLIQKHFQKAGIIS